MAHVVAIMTKISKVKTPTLTVIATPMLELAVVATPECVDDIELEATRETVV